MSKSGKSNTIADTVASTSDVSSTLTGRIVESIGELIRFTVTPLLLPIVQQNLVPDAVLRFGIRREIAMELAKIKKYNSEQVATKVRDFVAQLKTMPIAINQKEANDQHYEVPDEFYQTVLGPRLKYSSCFYETDKSTLAEAEIAMLELYCQRADLYDGMTLIDLGCGWGSVTLYMAEKYRNSQIISISNSNSQREFILSTAASRGLNNVRVFTGDITSFDLPAELHGVADRVISIEMFEHMKNYQQLLRKVSTWMKPKAKLFIHIFTSKDVPGHYESGWLAENFFTGGTLPSQNLLLHFQENVSIEKVWVVNGKHYQRTLEDWLKIMDGKKQQTLQLFTKVYGQQEAMKQYVHWRLFFIGCAEFFGACDGEEYYVTHYLFSKK